MFCQVCVTKKFCSVEEGAKRDEWASECAARRSVGVLAAGGEHGLDHDPEIEGKIPVLDVPNVFFHASFHLPQLFGLAAESGDLCPTGDAGAHEVTHHIFVDERAVFLSVLEHVWARPDERHIAEENIDELREFVDIGATHEVADARFAGIVLCGLLAVAVGIDTHGAEFVAVELLAVESAALLAEKNGPRAGEFDQCAEDEIDKGEDEYEQSHRYDEIAAAFEGGIVEIFERRGLERDG